MNKQWTGKIYDAVLGVAANSIIMDCQSLARGGVQVNSLVSSAAKTADCAKKASLALGTVTYTAVTAGTAGNLITIAFTAGGTAGSEVVTVVGTAISVQIDATPVTGSTGTQVAAAIAASVPAAALVSSAGTDATVQAVMAPTPLVGGAASEFSTANNTISIPSHAMFTGLGVQATKSGAAFPGGIAAATTYYVFVVDANTIALFDTQAHALAATQSNFVPAGDGLIDISSDGSADSVITLTPVSLSGASWKLQSSDDYNPQTQQGNWVDIPSATGNITTSTSAFYPLTSISWAYMRMAFAISAGAVEVDAWFHGNN